MGTDRNEILNKPCLCGNGRVTVFVCRPDHDYAHEGQKWHENKIECEDCASKYRIVESEKKLVLVKSEDVEQREAALKSKQIELTSLETQLWENLEKQGVLDSVVDYLNSFKTATGAYRQLSSLHICRDVDDFRKKFPKQNCTKERVKRYFYFLALEKLLITMNAPNKLLTQYFVEDANLRSREVPVLHSIGEPVLTLNF